jgi:hypothetical protein
MHRITYFASVDDGVSFDETEFRFLVMTYLHSPDGWVQEGYEFEEVPKSSAHVHIRLSSSKTVETVCGLSPNLSCAELGGRHMYLNATRWLHGAPKSKLDLENYRQYMVSHEMGHILGKGHTTCPKKGALAPIMIQQTLGLHGCRPNTNVTK